MTNSRRTVFSLNGAREYKLRNLRMRLSLSLCLRRNRIFIQTWPFFAIILRSFKGLGDDRVLLLIFFEEMRQNGIPLIFIFGLQGRCLVGAFNGVTLADQRRNYWELWGLLFRDLFVIRNIRKRSCRLSICKMIGRRVVTLILLRSK